MILARLKYKTPRKLEVLPRLFQRSTSITIRADILNKPFLVLYPWRKHHSPPPCVQLMNCMLAPRVSKHSNNDKGAQHCLLSTVFS